MLTAPIEKLVRLDTSHKSALKKLDLTNVRDILYHFPTRYADIRELGSTDTLEAGTQVTLYGKLSGVKLRKAWKSKVPMAEAYLEDHRGRIKVIWFNQAYIAKMYPEGSLVKLSGKISSGGQGLFLSNPEIAKIADMPIDTHDSLFAQKKEVSAHPENDSEFLTPVYRETKGITSRFILHTIQKLITQGVLTQIEDPVPESILEKYHLPDLKKALTFIHFPKSADHVTAARKRFAFEEIFFIQLTKARERAKTKETPAYSIKSSAKSALAFLKEKGIAPTKAQERAVTYIVEDIQKIHPMSRLLEGDVGSGKTAVAAACAYTTITTRPSFIDQKGKQVDQSFGTLQVAYMAPTEILARQHFESFCEFFKGTGISLGLITGDSCLKYPSKSRPGEPTKISKAQLLKWVENGEIAIVIGTHALIQKKVRFKHLGLVIVDEQHRFGIKQRKELAQKSNDFGKVAHLLSMTATPIPRTLALTIYGDLDLTILDEMPPGRKKIVTEIIAPHARERMYTEVKKELDLGRQVYVICPRIDKPDEEEAQKKTQKSVVAEAKRLQENIFQKWKVGVLHGKMRPAEKERIMKDFSDGKIDILVSTTVIEVGVNVPNASVIMIEGAERFGLSQLHQLRGRVLRGTHQPYCYIVSDTESEHSVKRLLALKKSSNGFELAEQDLLFRGAGELSGGKQSGITDIGMEAIKNIKLVEAARTEAQEIIRTDIELTSLPQVRTELLKRESIHLE
ncbi:MAG: ATP-dependent DNA helicase RecG [Minisyncoccia bacterium]